MMNEKGAKRLIRGFKAEAWSEGAKRAVRRAAQILGRDLVRWPDSHGLSWIQHLISDILESISSGEKEVVYWRSEYEKGYYEGGLNALKEVARMANAGLMDGISHEGGLSFQQLRRVRPDLSWHSRFGIHPDPQWEGMCAEARTEHESWWAPKVKASQVLLQPMLLAVYFGRAKTEDEMLKLEKMKGYNWADVRLVAFHLVSVGLLQRNQRVRPIKTCLAVAISRYLKEGVAEHYYQGGRELPVSMYSLTPFGYRLINDWETREWLFSE